MRSTPRVRLTKRRPYTAFSLALAQRARWQPLLDSSVMQFECSKVSLDSANHANVNVDGVFVRCFDRQPPVLRGEKRPKKLRRPSRRQVAATTVRLLLRPRYETTLRAYVGHRCAAGNSLHIAMVLSMGSDA
jgi:hypothetical protein